MALKVTNCVYISTIYVYTLFLFLLFLFLFLPSMSYYFIHCPTLIQAGRLHKEAGVVDAGHSAHRIYPRSSAQRSRLHTAKEKRKIAHDPDNLGRLSDRA